MNSGKGTQVSAVRSRSAVGADDSLLGMRVERE